MSPTNLHTSRTLISISMDLIAYTLDDNGPILLFLTQKPRYSVSVCPKKDFPHLPLIPLTLFLGPYIRLLDSHQSFFVMTSTSSM